MLVIVPLSEATSPTFAGSVERTRLFTADRGSSSSMKESGSVPTMAIFAEGFAWSKRGVKGLVTVWFTGALAPFDCERRVTQASTASARDSGEGPVLRCFIQVRPGMFPARSRPNLVEQPLSYRCEGRARKHGPFRLVGVDLEEGLHVHIKKGQLCAPESGWVQIFCDDAKLFKFAQLLEQICVAEPLCFDSRGGHPRLEGARR